MSNGADRNPSLSPYTSGYLSRGASRASLRQSLHPGPSNVVAAKEKELESLEILLDLSKETLGKINTLSSEFKKLNDGYQYRLLNNWNNIFRFANITANKRSEYNEPPVFVKLDLPPKDI